MQRYSSGATWEPIVGYSRAVKTGDRVHVSGSTSIDSEGNVQGAGDAAEQTRATLQNIQQALEHFGLSFANVYRTRIYVTDIENDWESVGRAHGEVFGEIRPACTMVEVSKLIDPDMLVEIEAEAYCHNKGEES